MTTVLIADDQAVVRAGLRTILEADDGIEVIGEASDGAQAVLLASTLSPDLVVMDIRMPVMDGIAATRRLAESGSSARVLVLTTFGLDDYVYGALRAGASGFMLKTEPPERLCAAVHIVAEGNALLGSDTTRQLIRHYLSDSRPSAPPPGLEDLTPRERDVLIQVARGLSNREVAAALFIGEGTVKTHLARVLAKLGLRDRVQLVVLAFETGLVPRAPS
jgi:DNA-binding NarL/FixJ family response regulator